MGARSAPDPHLIDRPAVGHDLLDHGVDFLAAIVVAQSVGVYLHRVIANHAAAVGVVGITGTRAGADVIGLDCFNRSGFTGGGTIGFGTGKISSLGLAGRTSVLSF